MQGYKCRSKPSHALKSMAKNRKSPFQLAWGKILFNKNTSNLTSLAQHDKLHQTLQSHKLLHNSWIFESCACVARTVRLLVPGSSAYFCILRWRWLWWLCLCFVWLWQEGLLMCSQARAVQPAGHYFFLFWQGPLGGYGSPSPNNPIIRI